MIHGYHLVLGTYGFWLPNDPRGSLSEKVYSYNLFKLGRPSKSIERAAIAPEEYQRWRQIADEALMFPLSDSLDSKRLKWRWRSDDLSTNLQLLSGPSPSWSNTCTP